MKKSADSCINIISAIKNPIAVDTVTFGRSSEISGIKVLREVTQDLAYSNYEKREVIRCTGRFSEIS